MRKAVLTLFLPMLLVAAMWWGVLSYHQQQRRKLFGTCLETQNSLLALAAESIKNRLDQPEEVAGSQNAEEWREWLAPLIRLNEGRVFIYLNGRLLFDQDKNFLKAHLGQQIERIFPAGSGQSGGAYASLVRGVSQGRDGWSEVASPGGGGMEHVAWTVIRRGGEAWVVGLSRTEAEVLDRTGLRERNQREIAAAFAITMLMALVCLFFWRNQRKDRRNLDRLSVSIKEKKAELTEVAEHRRLELEERVRAETALAESEKLYRTLVQTMNEGLIMADENGAITFVNEKLCRLTGQCPEELLGRPADYFLIDAVKEKFASKASESTEDPIEPYELGWIKKSGESVMLLASPSPVFGAQGAYRGAIVALTDITPLKKTENELKKSRDELEARVRERTAELKLANQDLEHEVHERRKTEQALAKSRERYELAARAAKVGVWEMDLVENVFHPDPTLKALIGYADDELPNDLEAWESHIHPEDRDRRAKAIEDHLKGITEEYACEYRVERRDGSERRLLARGQAIRDASGRTTRLVAADADITELKEAEEALRRSEEAYRSILRNIEDGFYETDLAGNMTRFNQAFQEMTGFEEEELLEKNYRKLMTEEMAREVYRTFNHVYRTGRPEKAFDWQIITNEGRRLWVQSSISPVRNSIREIIGFQGVVRDVTPARLAEAKLRRSEEKYKDILSTIEDGYYEVDRAGNLTFFNEALCEIVGYPAEELTGLNNRSLMDLETAKKVYKTFNRVFETGFSEKALDWQLIRKDGKKRWVEVSVSLIKDKDGRRSGFRGIVRDITEIVRAAKAVQHPARQ